MTSRAYGSAQSVAERDIRKTRRWQRLRRVILERDRYTCKLNLPGICWGQATSVDHIIPLSAGGAPYDPANLRAACGACNSSLSPGGRPGYQRDSHGRFARPRYSQRGAAAPASYGADRASTGERAVSLAGQGVADAPRQSFSPPAQPEPTGSPPDAPSPPRSHADGSARERPDMTPSAQMRPYRAVGGRSRFRRAYTITPDPWHANIARVPYHRCERPPFPMLTGDMDPPRWRGVGCPPECTRGTDPAA